MPTFARYTRGHHSGSSAEALSSILTLRPRRRDRCMIARARSAAGLPASATISLSISAPTDAPAGDPPSGACACRRSASSSISSSGTALWPKARFSPVPRY
jgi:hypothetical protein